MSCVSKFLPACRFDNFCSCLLFAYYLLASLLDFSPLQTVAVIPVFPHGVLQLGSSTTVSTNLCLILLSQKYVSRFLVSIFTCPSRLWRIWDL